MRLRELEKQQRITKHIDTSRFPIKCEYTLTNSGKDFVRIIKDIKKWPLQWYVESLN
ncbi:MAG TPA: winged helix-turn-helix transcriptional regulator [Candidatus Thermoplasmatota archaeon]|nr:winged helix-turn-helix transcriptional regulator [Candidatus Thermoplasmatota archaeon]